MGVGAGAGAGGARPGLEALVGAEAECVSARLRRDISSRVPALGAAAEHFFQGGLEGKRLRSSLVLLLSSALAAEAPCAASLTVDLSPTRSLPASPRRRQQRVAEVVELIHVASLVHDDVIDRAGTRRGAPALNIDRGNKLAVLAGDFLLARASVTLASLQNTEVVDLMSTVIDHLVTGEVMQMQVAGEAGLPSLEQYRQKTFYKTASMFANGLKSAAVAGGHAPEVSADAFSYGKHLGMAFQLVDDVLDFSGDAQQMGKPVLSDLGSGLSTAPVIFAQEEFPEIRELASRRYSEMGDVERASELVARSSGIARTLEMAEGHTHRALLALERLPDPECSHAEVCRAAMVDVAHRVLRRTK